MTDTDSDSRMGGGGSQPPTYLVAALLASVLGWLTPANCSLPTPIEDLRPPYYC